MLVAAVGAFVAAVGAFAVAAVEAFVAAAVEAFVADESVVVDVVGVFVAVADTAAVREPIENLSSFDCEKIKVRIMCTLINYTYT